ncbi:hypothetical protein FNV43_RR13571 [Rhamnella rubrinervis]|uniref:Uncharacterized protein n=1 Tax=Rhamnella rubrinervis TaxID=2594499 RepID=A0A8K0H1A0_9ROSA|nr:hypothetical protein FNV43_RR13571 [Rhamnella rubrinervis]
MKGEEFGDFLKGQAEIWQLLFAFTGSMALKCAVQLRIADIINSHLGPLTLSQIASHIADSPSPDSISYLTRIMRPLVHKKVFTAHRSSDGGETLYGLTHTSRWLLWDSKPNFVPLILLENNPLMLAPWQYLSHGVKDGGRPFDKAHGCDLWRFASENPEFNEMFNDGMGCMVDIFTEEVLAGYKDGFGCIGSLVNVGGGIGGDMYKIVKSHPHIKGVNFDLPHVIATAPTYPGVSHVGGDMFVTIPNADAIFLKSVLHDWSHDLCVEILKNCRKAIPENTGKVIIVDIVFDADDEDDIFKEARIILDMVMMAHTNGGKERTEFEWKKLLEEAGFPRYKITRISAIPSIIEAYPI